MQWPQRWKAKIGEIDQKQLQSQQDFIAAFTHEVKTPMTAMLGYADLMRARPDDTETQREAAGYIYHETQRLENLSRSLLALMGLDQAGALELVPCQDAGLLLQTVRSLPQGSTPVPRVISAGCVVQVDRSPVGGYAAQPDPQCPASLSGHARVQPSPCGVSAAPGRWFSP